MLSGYEQAAYLALRGGLAGDLRDIASHAGARSAERNTDHADPA
jgi:hypothetical protein